MSKPMLVVVSVVAALTSVVSVGVTAAEKEKRKVPASLNFTMATLEGKEVALSTYLGKVVLMVNVASECGLTPQYAQLQAMHKEYAKKGLAIVGFPCNQFGTQEPGTAKQIRQFCTQRYGVKFDMFAKVDVNGEDACKLYKHLTKLKTRPKGAGGISWNFEKFLLDREGNVIARFEPRTKPDAPEVVKLIERALAKK